MAGVEQLFLPLQLNELYHVPGRPGGVVELAPLQAGVYKGAQAHMERHIADLYPHFLHLLQQGTGKVESGGGCRGGADLAGVDSLVPLGVAQLRLDVGGRGILPRRSRISRKIPW